MKQIEGNKYGTKWIKVKKSKWHEHKFKKKVWRIGAVPLVTVDMDKDMSLSMSM